ncbi:MAG: hypothetical protein CMJ19_00295 [Phycisphaeraceae bacterium]|nr:hypothetical protein [Phycisphaeraceae bacterium]|tara:strand:+ start:118 stop:357 length:240 start_codon:yes stop_codon:yes gene_type:complete
MLIDDMLLDTNHRAITSSIKHVPSDNPTAAFSIHGALTSVYIGITHAAQSRRTTTFSVKADTSVTLTKLLLSQRDTGVQ